MELFGFVVIRENRRDYGLKDSKEKSHLLPIVDKHAEPRADFAVGPQQQATDVGH